MLYLCFTIVIPSIMIISLVAIFLASPGQHKNGTTTKAKIKKVIKVLKIVIAIGIAIGIAIIILCLYMCGLESMAPYAAIVITSIMIISLGAIILISPGQHKNGTTTKAKIKKVIKVIGIVIAVVIAVIAIIISILFILVIWLSLVWPK